MDQFLLAEVHIFEDFVNKERSVGFNFMADFWKVGVKLGVYLLSYWKLVRSDIEIDSNFMSDPFKRSDQVQKLTYFNAWVKVVDGRLLEILDFLKEIYRSHACWFQSEVLIRVLIKVGLKWPVLLKTFKVAHYFTSFQGCTEGESADLSIKVDKEVILLELINEIVSYGFFFLGE